MNRVGMGLAVGAGYLLGRTKKLKLAVAVGTMVAGKKLNLTPKGIAELVSGQLQNNPQFKEIGDQLRTDLRGVGKAASGAMVERQIGALADRLHGRTAEVRDQLSGAVPKAPGVGSRDSGDSEDPEEYAEQDDERDERDGRDADDEPDGRAGRDADDEPDGRAGRERDGRRPAGKTAPAARKAAKKAPAKKAPARKTAAKAPAKKAAVKRAQPAKKATGKKTAGARSAARGAGTRQSKGGGER
ncbi:DNA primase [Streptomyces olivaceus]|uniref:DNA primase n=1 Tax=Streptomyces olivaceus TaxID=47716 RepID=UPI001CCD7723|nr:DNA primase [Streptomyces olivaceus]MBZ6209441.1 DNA primase [Streptomyces olivaceus]